MESFDALLIGLGPMCELAIPRAQNNTILVVGATSRTGRIVVRKLMLGGSSVKGDQEVEDMLPRSVEIVIGDVGNPFTLKAAVENCNKIIYCATARSTITGDLYKVDHQGVYNLTKAFQDYDNKLAQLQAGKSSKSKLLRAKFKSEDSLNGWEIHQGTYFQDEVAFKYDAGMDGKFEFTEFGDTVFSGYVFTRGGYVELSKKAITSFRFHSSQVRVPFSSFRPVKPDDPPLDPFLVHTLTIRFEPRAQAGEDSLRTSGVGYTIIGPGPLREGLCAQRALIFDQGNRITQTLHDSTARNKSFDVCYGNVTKQGRELMNW